MHIYICTHLFVGAFPCHVIMTLTVVVIVILQIVVIDGSIILIILLI